MRLFFKHIIKLRCWLPGLLMITPLMVYSQTDNDISVIKAALSYNFAKYTQWPDSQKNKTITLCYFNPAYDVGFDKLANRTISGESVRVKKIDIIEDIADCQLAYIDRKDRSKLQRFFISLDKKPILTVSDMAGFVDDGGMIEIVSQDNKLRFKVNLEQLQKQGLTLSSQVLNLALEVKRDN